MRTEALLHHLVKNVPRDGAECAATCQVIE